MTRSRPVRLNLCALEARDNPSGGLLDTTFHGTGEEPFPNTTLDRAYGVAVQPDGKIVAAGYARTNKGDFVMQVVRTNADGSLDTTFDGTGMATLSGYGPAAAWEAVAIQPDGKIVVGGQGDVVRNMGLGYIVARYNANGTLDTTFGTPGRRGATGIWTYDPSSGAERLRALKLLTDGSNQLAGIMLEGQGFGPAGFAFAAMKLTPAGVLDTTYGSGGSTLLEFDGRSSNPYGMAVTSAGGVVMVGAAGPGNNGAIAVLSPAGQLDTGFNGTGYRVDQVAGSGGTIFDDVAVQPAGAGYRYVVVGDGFFGGAATNGIVTAYTSAGQLDTAFSSNGVYVCPSMGEFTHVALAADASVFAAGYTTGANPSGSVVAHLSADGTPDTSFGPTGDGLSVFGTDYDYVSAIAVDASGRPVVGCGLNDQGALARLTAP
jgi:uncharacterized delta-60 repeat protein